jgi:hypothetical protein
MSHVLTAQLQCPNQPATQITTSLSLTVENKPSFIGQSTKPYPVPSQTEKHAKQQQCIQFKNGKKLERPQHVSIRHQVHFQAQTTAL